MGLIDMPNQETREIGINEERMRYSALRSFFLEKSFFHLLNEADAPDRLIDLADFYKSLVESGIQSPFFVEVVQAVLSTMGGGG